MFIVYDINTLGFTKYEGNKYYNSLISLLSPYESNIYRTSF